MSTPGRPPTAASTKPQFRPLSIIRALRKHAIVICVAALAASVVGIAVTSALPAVYRAEAVILVESQRIPEKFVASTVSTDLQDRLGTLSKQILSYNRLLDLVNKFNLYRQERNTRVQEEIVDVMRADIGIRLERGWSKDRPGAFRISYQSKERGTVAQVANQLASYFIEENLRTRETQAVGTSEFLDNQLNEAKKKLEEQESLLSQYKLQYNGELPQQENALLTTLGHLQTQLQGTQDALNRAEQSKVLTDKTYEVAASTEAALVEIARARSSTATPRTGNTAAPAIPQTPTEVERLRQELTAMRTRYTAEHPEVKKLEQVLAEIERKRAAEAAAQRKPTEQPGNAPELDTREVQRVDAEAVLRARERVESLGAQREIVDKQIANLTKQRQDILDKIGAVQSHVANLPVREQQLATVTRDYEISKENYRSLLDKKLAAEMSADMEKRQKAERFSILDEARTPERPIKPRREVLYFLVVAGGLALGLAAGFALELRSDVLLGEWELLPGTAVVGRVPDLRRVIAVAGKPRNPFLRFRRLAITSSVMLAAATMAIAGTYLGWWRVF